MDIYTIDEYFKDLNDITIYNLKQMVNKDNNFKDLLRFFINNKIIFYYCYENKIICKEKNYILIDINNIKNNYINNVIIKLLKYINDNSEENIDEYFSEICLFIKNINNIKKNLNEKYDLIKNVFKINIEENEDFIAKYNNIN